MLKQEGQVKTHEIDDLREELAKMTRHRNSETQESKNRGETIQNLKSEIKEMEMEIKDKGQTIKTFEGERSELEQAVQRTLLDSVTIHTVGFLQCGQDCTMCRFP